MHGHRWDISISVSGPIGPDGFVIDFSELKRLVVSPLEDMFDHKILNDCYPFNLKEPDKDYWRACSPTAENLAEYILEFSVSKLAWYTDLWVSEVSVAETEDNIATVRQEEIGPRKVGVA
jgi:6-pyruvoyl-tetrahydropterin synthase